VQHSLLLEKVARRVQDRSVMKLLKMILKSTGTKGVPLNSLPRGELAVPRSREGVTLRVLSVIACSC
jgi:hypothetical protein